MMKYRFRSEGKDYPMVEHTEYWAIGHEKADDVGHKNYSDFFNFVFRNLNLPHDYAVLLIVPDTIKELQRAHAERGDYSDRHLEIERIKRDAEKLIEEFEDEYIPSGFFGSGADSAREVNAKKIIDGFQENPARKELLEHGTDLTEMAKNGTVDDCIGRETEIWAATLTLARRKKANPVLVGPAGVGKSQIVHGIAHRIARKEAGFLNDWTIIEMSSTGLVAGTKYVGELEKKMKAIIEAVKKCPKVILFIDEIHTIMGTGKGEKSTLDIANILKPVLASGDMKLIGATTDKEYHILQKDPAVERRFNKITVKEFSVEDSTKVLHGIKKVYEDFHGVKYYKAAVDVMCNVAKRYNPDRSLPDSAVDIMDYCGALAKVSDIKKITLAQVKEFAKKLYNLEEDAEVNTKPLGHREINRTIGFI